MNFSITEIPQADELTKVIATVEAVFKDNRTDTQIAEYVGFTDRQGRYYRLAAEILGLLENTNNSAKTTELGEDLVVLDEENRQKKLRTILRDNRFFNSILSFIEVSNEGISRSDLLSFMSANVEGAESTIARRLSTVINWLTYSSLIKLDFREFGNNDKETIYKINDQLYEDDFLESETPADSIYPVSYPNDELDIKETHMQVVSFLRKKEQEKILVPEFQRNQVWKQQQKSRFIESLILNIPVPPFYISQDLEGSMIVIDGLQRSSAIFDFFNNEYPLVGLEALHQLNGLSYQSLDSDIKARIEDRELLLYVLKPTVPMAIVYDIFNRINSNGTPLNRQEIRNCIYIGKATRLLADVAEQEVFKRATSYSLSPLRMKDRESILRFFAFTLYDYNTDYRGDMDDFLGKTMKRINRLSEREISVLEERFYRVMSLTYDFFGQDNFRFSTVFNSRGRINIALMEVICVFFDKQTREFLENNRDRIIDNYYNVLLRDAEFSDAVKTSTNSLTKVKTRFNKTFQILSNV